MHEAGVAERIVEAALAAAGERAGSVRIVEVEAGQRAVSDEALQFHWAEAARGTPIEGAALRIVPVDDPVALRLVALDVDGP
jgi:Zn finger protein HypA/HybF involved in hydrogenase expression